MTSDHIACIEVTDEVLLRGWTQAWVWTCRCGEISASCHRSALDAMIDHFLEHSPSHDDPRPSLDLQVPPVPLRVVATRR